MLLKDQQLCGNHFTQIVLVEYSIRVRLYAVFLRLVLPATHTANDQWRWLARGSCINITIVRNHDQVPKALRLPLVKHI